MTSVVIDTLVLNGLQSVLPQVSWRSAQNGRQDGVALRVGGEASRDWRASRAGDHSGCAEATGPSHVPASAGQCV